MKEHWPKGPGELGHAEELGFDRFHRHAGWDRITADRVACNSACYLLNIAICSDGGGAGDVTIYDGNSVAGRQMLDLRVLNGQWQDFPLRHPIFFQNGIYVDVGNNITSVFVHYLPIPR